MRALPPTLAALGLLAGCSAPDVGARLAPRAAEAIDPRVPVNRRIVELADPEMEARVAELVRQARAAEGEFAAAFATAQELTAQAGPAQSESWIAAQQAVSIAVAARAPVTRALGDLDAIAAAIIVRQSGIGAGAFQAIRSAQVEVAAIDRRQAELIDGLQRRLRG